MSIYTYQLKSGQEAFRVAVTVGSKTHFRRFRNKTDAIKWEQEILRSNHELHKCKYKPNTVEDLASYWLVCYAYSYKSPSSVRRDEGMIRNQILPYFKDFPLHSLEPKTIENWLHMIRHTQKLSPKSCNDVLGLLKKIYKDAWHWGFIDANPVLRVRKFKIEEKAFSFWSPREIQKFLLHLLSEVAEHPALPAIILALYTGMRKGEIIALKWDCVDFDRDLLTVRRSYCGAAKRDLEMTKSKKIRYIPICKTLRIYLNDRWRQHHEDDPYVIPRRATFDHLHVELKGLAKRIGVTPIRFHDLRHTFASNFLMGGGKIYDLQKILGHSTIQVTERYAHLVPEHLQGKTEVLDY